MKNFMDTYGILALNQAKYSETDEYVSKTTDRKKERPLFLKGFVDIFTIKEVNEYGSSRQL